MTTVLITGANRGIGLQLTKHYASEEFKVYALCRTPSEADDLKAVEGDVHMHQLDVTDPDSIKRLKDEIGNEPIDIFINNGGIYGGHNQELGTMNYSDWEKTLATNTIGPVRMVEAFYPNLKAAKEAKLITISSLMGSIEDASRGNIFYRTSKTAVNMAMHCIASDAKEDNITCIVMHPGWVQTDMGGENAPITTEESVDGIVHVISGLSTYDSGKFLNFRGEEIPW